MSIAELVEAGAEDVGSYMQVFYQGAHTRVAQWIEGNQMWDILPAGTEFLAQKAADEAPAKRSRKRTVDATADTPVEAVTLAEVQDAS